MHHVATTAGEQVRLFREGIPVILGPSTLAKWIEPTATPDAVAPLLAPYAGKLSIEPTKC